MGITLRTPFPVPLTSLFTASPIYSSIKLGAKLDLSLWEQFLDSKALKTRRNYEDAINFFLQANGWRNLNEALRALDDDAERAVIKFLQFLKKRGASANTLHLYLVPIRHLYNLYDIKINWLRIKGLMPKKREIRADKPLTKDLVKRILPMLRNSKRLLIWFLFATGVRVGEAINLKVKDLDLNADPPRAIITTEKSYVERVVFIPADLGRELKEWVKNKAPEDFVFHNERRPQYPIDVKKVRKALQAALLRVGALTRDKSGKGWVYTLHGLRDGFKTTLTNAGMNGLILETLMGHDTGIDRSYYKPSIEQLAAEWRKFEGYLLLENGAEVVDRMRLLEEKVAALTEAVETYERIIDAIIKKNPRALKELGIA